MPMAKSLLLLSCVILMSLSASCVTLGPKVEKQTVFVRLTDDAGNPVKVGVVARNVRVPIDYKTEAGEIVRVEVDIGGWSVIPPRKSSNGEAGP